MHVARGILAAALLALLVSCTPKGPLTPEDALSCLDRAWKGGNGEAMTSLLSRDSVERISKMNGAFAAMTDSQRETFAAVYGLPAESLKKLSLKEGVVIFMFLDRDRSALHQALKHGAVKIERSADRAVFTMGNGMEVPFVREGPYWKLDISDL